MVCLGDVPVGESEEPVANDWQKTQVMVKKDTLFLKYTTIFDSSLD